MPAIAPEFPAERLVQIATGKLNALGLSTAIDPVRKTLRGELTFKLGRVVHPINRVPITGGTFSVVGHDHLLFSSPPLSALGPIKFYDLASTLALEERVAAALSARMMLLQQLAEKLKMLRAPASLDADRLVVVGEVQAVSHRFQVCAGPEGVWISRVTATHGEVLFSASSPTTLLDLAQYQSPVDLELYLTDAVPALQQQKAAPPPRAPEPAKATLEVKAAPNALSLSILAQRFGPEAVLTMATPCEVTQDFTFNGGTHRFSAVHVSGTTFKGKLTGPTGEKWSDKFDLLRFPGIAQVVANVLGAKLRGTEPPAAPAPATAPATNVPDHLVPQVGEVWVMNVIVERDDAGEIRYACTNIDGKPFGAARILKRAEFEAVFTQAGTGWRLPILIEELGADGSVIYRQLDSQRQPRGGQKRMLTAILVTTFIPEATAY
jgi:hypothetical protein